MKLSGTCVKISGWKISLKRVWKSFVSIWCPVNKFIFRKQSKINLVRITQSLWEIAYNRKFNNVIHSLAWKGRCDDPRRKLQMMRYIWLCVNFICLHRLNNKLLFWWKGIRVDQNKYKTDWNKINKAEKAFYIRDVSPCMVVIYHKIS